MEKVVVGMSGGIDSFVTALMLREKGYDVVGVSLELWEKNDLTAVEKICRALEIPLLCRHEREGFRQVVVEAFVRDYLSGYTPSPCCVCNRFVKWDALERVAAECGASRIATGHYVRIRQERGKYYICQGVDARKDQSYFLYGVSQKILSKALTPLGDYTKEEVRAWALAHGYEEVVRKKESMGVCFLRGTDYRDFIRQYAGADQKPGMILSRSGQPIGLHDGLLNYTVGQKRGMPLWYGEPMYVAEIDADRNV
ncbi:MAG: tRNA 2-thiouridine(34) synthase MnmA, partial [Odoribacter sp.]|nr:tRNA 2-thiouridine(34) synthase MnmA [Odoribacter sp.]